MSTKLIRLQDGTLVEVELRRGDVREISGGDAESVKQAISQIEGIIEKISNPVVKSLEKIKQSATVETVEIEVGLSFEGEGNLYIVKSKGSASLSIKLVLNPNNSGK